VELRQLEVFCKVVELKSFSKAAEAVFLTQPTVSQHISALERYFDTKLLDRLGKEIKPTHAGELLYRHAREIIALREKTYQELQQFLGKRAGHVRIGASTIPGEYVLPELIGKFKEEYPEIIVTLTIGDTKQVVESLIKSDVELGVVGAKIKNDHLMYYQFVEDRIALVVGRNHPFWGRQLVQPSELIDVALIQREDGSGTRISTEKVLAGKGVDPRHLNVIAEMGSTESVKQGVLAGIGGSFLSERAIRKEQQLDLLRALPIKGIEMKRSFYIIINKKRTLSPLCRELKSFLLKQKDER
jgi:DNA-binding transcriptional LysR family regulator